MTLRTMDWLIRNDRGGGLRRFGGGGGGGSRPDGYFEPLADFDEDEI